MTRSITALALPIVLPMLAAGVPPVQAQTATAPNTSSVGRVMPPSRGARDATPGGRRVRTPREAQNDKLMRGICIGCNAR
jgi:hypothetical protein